MEKRKLIELAKSASENSYSPYSKYKVGAVVLTKEGKVYKGTNIENSSFGATCCAERVALFNAISEGERNFDCLVVYSKSSLPFPCGICRQVLADFNMDMKIIIATDNEFKEFTLKELLPNSFNF